MDTIITGTFSEDDKPHSDSEIVTGSEKTPLEVSVFELIKQIENGTLDPKTLSNDQKLMCVEGMRGRGYTTAMIAEELKVHRKWAYRAVKGLKDDDKKFVIFPGFQKQLVSEIHRSWEAQHSRLIKLSYSAELSSGDRMRAILAAHQVQKNGLQLLLDLGYIGRHVTERDVRQAEEEKQKRKEEAKKKKMVSPLDKAMIQLMPIERDELIDLEIRRLHEMEEEVMKKAQGMIDERDRRNARIAAEEQAEKERKERQDGEMS